VSSFSFRLSSSFASVVACTVDEDANGAVLIKSCVFEQVVPGIIGGQTSLNIYLGSNGAEMSPFAVLN